jgi:hypothetical protein
MTVSYTEPNQSFSYLYYILLNDPVLKKSEGGKILKEVIMTCLKVITQHLSGRTETDHIYQC